MNVCPCSLLMEFNHPIQILYFWLSYNQVTRLNCHDLTTNLNHTNWHFSMLRNLFIILIKFVHIHEEMAVSTSKQNWCSLCKLWHHIFNVTWVNSYGLGQFHDNFFFNVIFFYMNYTYTDNTKMASFNFYIFFHPWVYIFLFHEHSGLY